MKKNQLIILTFSTGEKLALKYTIKALDFIYRNFDYLDDMEIITIIDPSKIKEVEDFNQNGFYQEPYLEVK